MRPGLPACVLVLALLAATAHAVPDPKPHVPRAAPGFLVALLAPVDAPTALALGPGDGDGPDLYAATLAGDVVRVALAWTAEGPAAAGLSVHAAGFDAPRGLAFDGDAACWSSPSPHACGGDVLYVADEAGQVTRVAADGARTVVVAGLRGGLGGLRFGPEGRLHVAHGGADVPYGGALLSVDVDSVAASPAILRWEDDEGNAIPPADVAPHPVNAPFAEKVNVVARGFRDVRAVAFDFAGRAYSSAAGDGVAQDALFRVEGGADLGAPSCDHSGAPGSGEAGVSVVGDPGRCAAVPPATALLGWHSGASGLAVANGGPFGHAAYVAERGPLEASDALGGALADPDHALHGVGRKVVRVPLDDEGRGLRVEDFLAGLSRPVDLLFGPDGALYIADAGAILRVAPLSVLPSAT